MSDERDLFVKQFRKFKGFTQFVEVDDEGAGYLFDALKTGEIKSPVTPKQQCADEMYEMLEDAMCLLAESNDSECKKLAKEIIALRAKARCETD